ncbi:MAG: GAF domain-containing protein [Leptolyngbyaceae cyanobacterium CRU_2_3]|nr:GAF domain-containing protein [Leptolyngbyaceae cyanobacterium CRU_2_3]
MSRQDEIGVLTQNMNQMVARLESSEDQARREAEQARLNALLKSLGSEASTIEELEKMLGTGLQLVREQLGADRVVLHRFNADWSGIVSVESVDPRWPSALNRTIIACNPPEVLERFRQRVIAPLNNIFEADLQPNVLQLMRSLRVQSSVFIPVVIENQLFGLLIVDQCASPRTWQEYEITGLQETVTHLEAAIGRVTLLTQLKIWRKKSASEKKFSSRAL